MTKYNLTLYSKNKESLNHFLEFIQLNNNIHNFQIIKNLLKKKKTKKKLSVLKSPHVNKTAQEQFEYTYYFLKVSCYSWDIKKYLILIKKIQNHLFPDIRTKINISKNKISTTNKLLNINQVSFYSTTLNFTDQKFNIQHSNTS